MNNQTWLSDTNGNHCSIEYFGSKEAAQKALDSLKNCKNCTNCSDCSGCSRCSDCWDCSGCSGCSRCSDCWDCSGCSRCSDCWDCSGCSRCSRCSRCSDCSDCSNIAWLEDKKDLQAEPSPDGCKPGVPATPIIKNIHQKIYEAVSQPKALEMDQWHTCGSIHCRGGWVVHLAGAPGYELERFHGTLLAAQLIYRESGAPINPCRFFDGHDVALADMKRLAEDAAATAKATGGK